MTGYPIRTTANVNPLEDVAVISSGEFINQAIIGAAYSNAAFNKSLRISPFKRVNDLVIDQIGIGVATGVASSTARIGIYSSTDFGPFELLWESQALATTSTGYKSEDLDFTFTGGTVYWLAMIVSDAVSTRNIAASSWQNMGQAAGSDVNMLTHFKLDYGAFPGALPTDLTNVSSLATKTTGNVPAIIMRVA